MDIIHHPVFNLKRDVSEAEICLGLQVESTQMAPEEKSWHMSPDTSNNTNGICRANTTQTINESYYFSTFHLHTCKA
jgi:hypothetical protein